MRLKSPLSPGPAFPLSTTSLCCVYTTELSRYKMEGSSRGAKTSPAEPSMHFVTDCFLGTRLDGIIGAMLSRLHLAALAAAIAAGLLAPSSSGAQAFPLDSANGLEPHGVAVEPVTYQGRKAVRVTQLSNPSASSNGPQSGSVGGIAVLPAASFHDGVIEVELAGK